MSTSEITKKPTSKSATVEQFMRGIDTPSFSITLDVNGRFNVSTYWPNGDVIRDKHCFGRGATIDEAVETMLAEMEKAKLAKKKLKTAAECKDAVLALIREHDAAPASFRDAVDDLPVA